MDILNDPWLVQLASTLEAEHGLIMLVFTPRSSVPFNAEATVVHPTRGGCRYAIAVRHSLSPTSAATLRHHVPAGTRTLVLAPHITTETANVLREDGHDFADSAGNLHLEWAGLLMDVRGRRAASVAPASKGSRAFSKRGCQVLMVLLSEPSLVEAPLRDIADVSGVSVGTTQAVLTDLAEMGLVGRTRTNRRLLVHTARLLDLWVDAYARALSPNLDQGRFEAPEDGSRAYAQQLVDRGDLWGGETAAHAMDDWLQPITYMVYVSSLDRADMARHRLRRDPDGPIILRQRFWSSSLRSSAASTVPAPLVYADLLAAGDPRQREQAARIRETNPAIHSLVTT